MRRQHPRSTRTATLFPYTTLFRSWVSSYANSPVLSRMCLSDSGANEKIKLPAFDEDAVAFIAQNPTRHEEFAIATFKRSAYITQDRGATWTQIADGGDRKSVV